MPVCVVTGATGFVGKSLLRQLVSAGWTVHALKRSGSDLSELSDLNVTWIEADLLDIETIEDEFPSPCDALFHLASDTSAWRRNDDRQTRVNVDGTRALLKLAKRMKVGRFIYTSSISAYGFHNEAITESSAKLGRNSGINYLHTKCLADEMVIAAADELDTVVLNPCHIMGPGDRHNWAQLFDLIKQQKLPGIPAGGGPFCHVDEIARAHLLAYEKGKRGENYILDGEYHSMADACALIAEQLGVPLAARVISPGLLTLLGYLKQAVAGITNREPDITPEKAAMVSKLIRVDSQKAVDELGYRNDIPLTVIIADALSDLQSS
ncbi:NAD-dependent epimerase/dehydratase family protein [Corallincola platygyrae]|uniref:NAD-dependent epimerase/dehydratase family protein n=1 Tax=Corallincola platygyrae TaxID=1193278 RepID=A0ABW4XPU4_9GAMM